MIGHSPQQSLQKCVNTESGRKGLKMSMRESSYHKDWTVAALYPRGLAGDLPQSLCVSDIGTGPRICSATLKTNPTGGAFFSIRER